MTSFVLNPNGRPVAWQFVFAIGIGGLVFAAIKAWWSVAPAAYQPPPPAAAVPASAPVITSASRPTPVPSTAAKVVQSLPPVSSFTPSRIAPADLPPELAGLVRPPPDPEPWVAPVGVQPGYKIPGDPQPRDVR